MEFFSKKGDNLQEEMCEFRAKEAHNPASHPVKEEPVPPVTDKLWGIILVYGYT